MTFISLNEFKRDTPFLQRASTVIKANLGNPKFSAADFCQSLYLSRTNLHRRLKKATGKSATAYIRHIRLQQAAYLLKHTDKSIAQIAYETGFQHLSYFAKCFKEEYGVVPGQYRTK